MVAGESSSIGHERASVSRNNDGRDDGHVLASPKQTVQVKEEISNFPGWCKWMLALAFGILLGIVVCTGVDEFVIPSQALQEAKVGSHMGRSSTTSPAVDIAPTSLRVQGQRSEENANTATTPIPLVGGHDRKCRILFDALSSPPNIPGAALAEFEYTMFSQVHQDWVVTSIFATMTGSIWQGPGFTYVDLAANDAILHSNTYFMDHCLGWKGLCIEANPAYHPKIRLERTCKLVGTCISDQVRSVRFDGNGGEVGHIDGNSQNGLQLTCTTLKIALGEAAINHIHYMSLDVEGHEHAALRGVDWSTTTIDAITIENPKGAEMLAFLQQKGFVPVLCIAQDTLYLRAANTVLMNAARTWWDKTGRKLLPQCVHNDTSKCVGATGLAWLSCMSYPGK